MKPSLIVMVKEPRPGLVKTRLGRDIGMVAAAWWYRHHVTSMLRRLRDPRWRLVVAYAPQGARWMPGGAAEYVPQGSGDLGRRMISLLRRNGPCSLLIGSDILGVTPAHIARALNSIRQHDAVLGPSPDGGYWLIGLRHPARSHPDCLSGTRWSTRNARADTLSRLTGRVGFVVTLSDVDSAADLP